MRRLPNLSGLECDINAANYNYVGTCSINKSDYRWICEMKTVAIIGLISIVNLLAGCFDNDYGIPDSPAAGVYLTESVFVSDAYDSQWQLPVVVIIASTGEARFMFFSSWSSIRGAMHSPQLTGNVIVEGETFSSSLNAYVHGDLQTDIVGLMGTVMNRDGIFGTYTWGHDFGRIYLTYSTSYERPSAINMLEGIWNYSAASSGGAIFTFTIAIDSDGMISGSNAAGCVYNGKVSIIDSFYNIYRLTLDASLCGELDGTYAGLATLGDKLGSRSLTFGVSTPEHSLNGMLMAPPLP